jgi:hypothetical protein
VFVFWMHRRIRKAFLQVKHCMGALGRESDVSLGVLQPLDCLVNRRH